MNDLRAEQQQKMINKMMEKFESVITASNVPSTNTSISSTSIPLSSTTHSLSNPNSSIPLSSHSNAFVPPSSHTNAFVPPSSHSNSYVPSTSIPNGYVPSSYSYSSSSPSFTIPMKDVKSESLSFNIHLLPHHLDHLLDQHHHHHLKEDQDHENQNQYHHQRSNYQEKKRKLSRERENWRKNEEEIFELAYDQDPFSSYNAFLTQRELYFPLLKYGHMYVGVYTLLSEAGRICEYIRFMIMSEADERLYPRATIRWYKYMLSKCDIDNKSYDKIRPVSDHSIAFPQISYDDRDARFSVPDTDVNDLPLQPHALVGVPTSLYTGTRPLIKFISSSSLFETIYRILFAEYEKEENKDKNRIFIFSSSSSSSSHIIIHIISY